MNPMSDAETKETAADWDPLSPEALADPTAEHARLRAEHPVARSERWEGFWALTRYDDIVRVTQDPETFSSLKASIPASTQPEDPVRGPLEVDPPAHAPYRALLNPYFAPRQIRRLEPEIRAIAAELLDGAIAAGTVDVVAEVAFPMPVRVLCAFLGLPPEDGMQLKYWANEVIRGAREGDRDAHRAANEAMYDYVRQVIRDRRANPRDPESDLTSGLLGSTLGGEPLSEEQVAGTLRLLFAAGHGTTTNGIGNCISYLAQHPQEQEMLRERPEMIPNAVEEILRVWSPSRALGRVATRDVDLHGRRIRAGEKVALVWASGNRDESVFDEADTVRIGRKPNKHIAFGNGIHTCLGAPLARAELKILVEELLARTESFEPAGAPQMAGWPHVGPESLPVSFRAAARRPDAPREGTTSAPPPSARDYPAVVVGRRELTDEIVEITLAGAGPEALPRWEPGAHVDLKLESGIVRQYSLCGEPEWNGVWRIAVLREPAGRGGSRFVHDELHPGRTLIVHGPRNHFALQASPNFLFIAGGIGITPLLPMIRSAEARGAEWSLLYAGRSLDTMAYRDELARFGDRVTLHPRDCGRRADLGELLARPRPDTQVYCCGPESLVAAVEQQCESWPAGSLHLERFAARPIDEADNALDEFEVEFWRSGITVRVDADTSIVEACEAAGVTIPTSCNEGTCGSCESVVLGGVPAHRDSVLSAEDRAEGRFILPCVSRSCTSRLTLDL